MREEQGEVRRKCQARRRRARGWGGGYGEDEVKRKEGFGSWNERWGGMNRGGPCERACETRRIRRYKTILRCCQTWGKNSSFRGEASCSLLVLLGATVRAKFLQFAPRTTCEFSMQWKMLEKQLNCLHPLHLLVIDFVVNRWVACYCYCFRQNKQEYI